jgi:putative ABC transport system permease protein
MRRLRATLIRFGNLFRKGRRERELAEELESHLQMSIDDNLRSGMTPEEARRQALIKLGGIEQTREICRDTWGVRIINELAQDVRYGLRQLRRNRGFAAVAVITLALGIGATTAIFSVVYGALLDPFPFTDSHRMAVLISHDTREPGAARYTWVSPAEFLDYREQNHVFDWVIGGGGDGVLVTGAGLPRWMEVARVTGNFFQSVGGKPVVGRTIIPADCTPGAPPVIVLSYKTWLGKFDKDPGVVGHTLVIDHQPTTIVGVMPPRFVPFGGEAFLPQILSHAKTSNQRLYLAVMGHLKPGVTFQQANADIAALSRRLARIYPKDHPKEVTFTAEPYVWSAIGAQQVRTILVLFGGVGLLMLIACVNVANLLLARASTRQHEIAIRAALGAGRARLIRQFLLESLLLAAGGGLLGCVLAWSGLSFLVALFPRWYMPSEALIRINLPVLLFTVGVAVVSTLLFGLAPAVLAAKKDLQTALSVSGRGGGESGGRHWLRNPLVVSEVALSLVLLTGAGLLFRSFWTLQHIKLGYNPDNVLEAGTALLPDHYKTTEARNRFWLEALRRVRALPGVVSASVGWPVIGNAPTAQVEIAGQSSTEAQTVWFRMVDDMFFKTMGIPLLAGRTISEADMTEARPVAMVNRAFANKYFAGKNSLGAQVKLKPPDFFPPMKVAGFEIIGVVGDTVHAQGVEPSIQPQIFLPFTVAGTPWGIVFARTAGNAAALTNPIQSEFASLNKELPVDAFTIRDDLRNWYIEPSFVMGMLTGFALLGMMLVCVGVYGVLSYAVSQRTQEIGVRMALGAQVSDVRRMVLKWGLRWLAIGIGLGVPASIVLEKVLRNHIWGITSADPLTLVAVSLVLTAVGLLACYIPARRAAKVDPMVALRYE